MQYIQSMSEYKNMGKLLKSLLIVFISSFLLLDAQASNNSAHFFFYESSETKSEKNQECSIEEDFARLCKFSFPKFAKLSKKSFKIAYRELWTTNSQITPQHVNIDRSPSILPFSISASPVLRI